ncbi:MAG: DUF4347 domain-containing protein [Leptolyngbyaceae cyanobacterium]
MGKPGLLGKAFSVGVLLGCLLSLLVSIGSRAAIPTAPRQEVVLIDAAVEQPSFFLQQLQPHQQGIVLTPQDTLASVTQRLEKFEQLQAIHLISHGTPGQFQLGQTVINAESLRLTSVAEQPRSQSALLAEWGDRLAPDGDILLYGCDIASSSAGQQLLAELQTVIGADIAASTNLSGDIEHGGNWMLERHRGVVTTAIAWHPGYATVLRQIAVTTSADAGEGSLRWAITQANATVEDDLIELRQLAAPIQLRSPLPTIHSNLYLEGHGATVSGSGTFRVLQVQTGDVALHNLIIADGLARGANGIGDAGGSAGLGGGLLIEEAGVTLSQVRLVNNRAEGGSGGYRPATISPLVKGKIETKKVELKVNRGAIVGINGISLSPSQQPAQASTAADASLPESPSIRDTDVKYSANRGAIAGVNGIGVNGIGSIAFGGGGGFGGFGNAGNGGNGGNAGAAGGNGGNGGDGGDGGIGIFGGFGRWEENGSIGSIAYGGGGGFGGDGSAGGVGNQGDRAGTGG